MGRYSIQGKIIRPLSSEEWLEAMENGRFVKDTHRGYVALLYYTAVRRGEALRTKKEQLVIRGDRLYYSIGKRLKRGKETAAIFMPLDRPYVDDIVYCWEKADPGERIWPFCAKTAYNIVTRVLPAYPHYFRLSRITNLLKDGWTIADLKSWTGLSLQALDYYVGLVNVEKMGESLR